MSETADILRKAKEHYDTGSFSIIDAFTKAGKSAGEEPRHSARQYLRDAMSETGAEALAGLSLKAKSRIFDRAIALAEAQS